MIGIIGAMNTEVETLISALTDKTETVVAGSHFFSGKLGSTDAVVVMCGILAEFYDRNTLKALKLFVNKICLLKSYVSHHDLCATIKGKFIKHNVHSGLGVGLFRQE